MANEIDLTQWCTDLARSSPDHQQSLLLIGERVSELLQQDPGLLFSHLYRLDIEEKDLRKILEDYAPELWPEKLAEAIWQRQMERIESKKRIRVNPVHEEGWDF